MTTGRVAVLKDYRGDFELREYPVPDPERGAVLVRLTRAGVCGSDLHIWRGETGYLPFGRLISHVFPLVRITEAFQEAEWKDRGADGLRLSRAAVSMVD
jgi:D-arabinose 1-dehydrogenase-like Zn-dependent alcohol dehydrogenase